MQGLEIGAEQGVELDAESSQQSLQDHAGQGGGAQPAQPEGGVLPPAGQGQQAQDNQDGDTEADQPGSCGPEPEIHGGLKTLEGILEAAFARRLEGEAGRQGADHGQHAADPQISEPGTPFL